MDNIFKEIHFLVYDITLLYMQCLNTYIISEYISNSAHKLYINGINIKTMLANWCVVGVFPEGKFPEHFLGAPIKSLCQCPMPVPYIGYLPFRWTSCPQFLAESIKWEHMPSVIGATTSGIQPEMNTVSLHTTRDLCDMMLEIFLDPICLFHSLTWGLDPQVEKHCMRHEKVPSKPRE